MSYSTTSGSTLPRRSKTLEQKCALAARDECALAARDGGWRCHYCKGTGDYAAFMAKASQ